MNSWDQHLSLDRIKCFVYGDAMLQPQELVHLKNCDDCSFMWWKLKKEVRSKKAEEKDKSA